MRIHLNGQPTDIPDHVHTIQTLLTWFGVTPDLVVVEKNEEVFKMGQFDAPIQEEDTIEIVQFMGGGS